MSKRQILVVVILLSWACLSYGLHIKVIKDPKPTHTEKNYVPLKKIGEVKNDISDNDFIAEAFSLTVDSRGNLFIFDRVQACIFKFDNKLRFIRRFGRRGRGPGEFAAHRRAAVEINVTGKEQLYVFDPIAKRITLFDLDGKYLVDHKVKYPYFFIPQAGKKGEIYIPSVNKGIIDVFDKQMKLIDTLLDEDEFRAFLFFEPTYIFRARLMVPNPSNLMYDLSQDGKLLAYNLNSSTVYLLKDHKLEEKFHIWPERVLKLYKKQSAEALNEDEPTYVRIAANFFADNDNNDLFYIDFGTDWEKGFKAAYQFNLQGELEKVLYLERSENDPYTHFKLKQNNIFYAIKDGQVLLYTISK